jgi:hypothetical protein
MVQVVTSTYTDFLAFETDPTDHIESFLKEKYPEVYDVDGGFDFSIDEMDLNP